MTESADAVPRGTTPPAAAVDAFGAALPVAERFAAFLAGPGVDRGLIGPREVPRLWDRHLLNSVAVASLIPTAAHVWDIGSGAGLPGIALAIQRPDLRVTLVEPLLRRVRFLDEAVEGLHLQDRVDVLRARAEELPVATAPVVVARAVAPLERLLRWCLPALSANGQLLALKGSNAAAELAAAADELAAWPGYRADLMETSVLDSDPTWVVRVMAPPTTRRLVRTPARGRTSSTSRPVGGRRPRSSEQRNRR